MTILPAALQGEYFGTSGISPAVLKRIIRYKIWFVRQISNRVDRLEPTNQNLRTESHLNKMFETSTFQQSYAQYLY